MAIVLLLGTLLLPASVSASSSKAVPQFTSSTATSFFSSLSNALSSIFQKDKPSYGYPQNNHNTPSWSDWLKGNKGEDLKDWWDNLHNDSYKIWEKYYCY